MVVVVVGVCVCQCDCECVSKCMLQSYRLEWVRLIFCFSVGFRWTHFAHANLLSSTIDIAIHRINANHSNCNQQLLEFILRSWLSLSCVCLLLSFENWAHRKGLPKSKQHTIFKFTRTKMYACIGNSDFFFISFFSFRVAFTNLSTDNCNSPLSSLWIWILLFTVNLDVW